jgi:hypothetical protein
MRELAFMAFFLVLSGCATPQSPTPMNPFECAMSYQEVREALRQIPSELVHELSTALIRVYSSDDRKVFGFTPSALASRENPESDLALRATIPRELAVIASSIHRVPDDSFCDHPSAGQCVAWHDRMLLISATDNGRATQIDCTYLFGEF